jgi:L-ascorbate metabolism protein UlaG (beta-lactamase superfamily)
MKKLMIMCFVGTLAAPLPASSQRESTADSLLTRELGHGDAVVWYLSHAGWAVRTAAHLLVFDYWERVPPTAPRTLDDGYVDPAQLGDHNVVVFVTHSHGDHFDPIIYEWRGAVPNITYVFGWQATTAPEFTYLTEPYADVEIDGVRIRTVNHAFDGVPEVAFLVEADGVTVFHSGDHGSTGDEVNPLFTENIDYLASLGREIDIAFLSIFGRRGGGVVNQGDLYTLDHLQPRITFPMHRGGAEEAYEEWARAVAESRRGVNIRFPARQGDVFVYEEGRITR